VVLENELDHDTKRVVYPAGHAGFKLDVEDDEIQVFDLDRGELVVNLVAQPTDHFERVEKPPLVTGTLDRRSTRWKIATIDRGGEATGVFLTVSVREPSSSP
jgi:hypothetical protein